MSTSIAMKLTTAGRGALWNAQSTGVNAGLTHIQIGTGHRTPDGSETTLLAAQQTTTIAAGSKPSATQIRVSGLFPGVTNYEFSEVAVFIGNPASGGVMFAYYSVPTGKIGTMVAGTDFVFAHEWTMAASDAASITIVADAGQSSMLSMMAAHEGAADPHPQYATEAYLLTLAGTANPLMNGAVSPGTGYFYSRVNHVHPVDTSRQAALGYTPVQQGTGVGQAGNVIKIGWDGVSKLKATVDNGDLGKFAFEAWVLTQIAALVNSSPGTLDTLNELAAALGNDPNFATTITNLIAGKASKSGDTFSGGIAVTSASSAQMQVVMSGYDSVIFFSQASGWGLYSNSGGNLINYERASGKKYFAGIDSTEIVRNNGGTYNINITGSAAWSNLTGRPAGADRNTYYQYRSGSPQWLLGTNNSEPDSDYLYSPAELSVGYAANAGAVTDLSSIPGSSGSRSIPGGDKEKWGVLYLGDILSGVQTYSVTFPVSFGYACDNLQLTIEDSTVNSSALDIKIRSRSASGFTLQIFESSGFVQNLSIHWTAKGR